MLWSPEWSAAHTHTYCMHTASRSMSITVNVGNGVFTSKFMYISHGKSCECVHFQDNVSGKC